MNEIKKVAKATHPRLALLSVCLAAVSMPFTFTGTALALPEIGRSFAASPLALNWVTNGFMLSFGSLLMAAGALADAFGRKRVFLSGLLVFLISTLSLILAPNILGLDLLRFVQGAGAAAAFSGGMAALAQEVAPSRRLRFFSMVGASFGLGLSLGPVASGLMIELYGWRSIFLLVAGFALASLLLGLMILRESRDPGARGLDWAGASIFTLALSLLTYGVLRAPASGWSDPAVGALLIGAVAAFLLFWRVEKRAMRPMLDLSLFAYPRFVGVQLLAAAPAYAFVVLLILLPVRFVGLEGMGALAGGQLMIALSAPLLVLPILAGHLARWFSPASICGCGLVICACGLFWLSSLPLGTAPLHLVAPLMTIGIGISLPWGLMDGLAVSVVPSERAGMATGIFSTTRVAGEGVALAIVSALLSSFTAAYLGTSGIAAAAAQRIVTGDLAGAAALLPEMPSSDLLHAYGAAFHDLLLVLTAITLFTAIIVFAFLGRGHAAQQQPAT